MRHSPLSIVPWCPRVENVERRVLFSTMTPMPALASGAAGAGAQALGAGSYLLVVFTGIAGLVGTLAWWQFG